MCRIVGLIVSVTFICSLLDEARAAPQRVSCDPSGTEHQRIGCIDNMNVDLFLRLLKAYEDKLSAIYSKCEEDNPGGGSGGHADRATCVLDALGAEAARMKLPAD